jgi:tetrahydromethanopterin S-methyltransferase subunit A
MMTHDTTPLAQIKAELRDAISAKKCWRCGCFQDTVSTLQSSVIINPLLASQLEEARSLYEPRQYDCLGCEVCWPAVAQNLAAELDSAVAEGSHCATEEPEAREGWPPLPGDYQVIRFQAPVAVCALNSDHLIKELGDANINGLCIVGSLHTENLGIEHLIRNILANPYIRFLIICGEDTRKTIGHLPGQSLIALMQHGVNEKMRIINATGKRPLLKNIAPKQVEAFRNQVRVIEQIGNTDIAALIDLIIATAIDDPGPFTDAPSDVSPVAIEAAKEPGKLVLDPAGYFVVYPDRTHQRLVLEHYTNKGMLDRMFSANSAAALYISVVDAELISRLDHAAYLGRELARAEHALQSGNDYVQDRAPGEMEPKTNNSTQQNATTCGCRSEKGESCK